MPKLERLLLDADVRADVKPLLEAVGFRVQFAPPGVGGSAPSDTEIVRRARGRDQIVVCHDKHRDKQTRLELYSEVYHGGGRIIRVGGPPGQDPLIIVGKILANVDKWRDFFSENDGMVLVHREGIKYFPSYKLYARVQATLDVERVTGRKVIKPSRQRKPKKRPKPSAQMPMRI